MNFQIHPGAIFVFKKGQNQNDDFVTFSLLYPHATGVSQNRPMLFDLDGRERKLGLGIKKKNAPMGRGHSISDRLSCASSGNDHLAIQKYFFRIF